MFLLNLLKKNIRVQIWIIIHTLCKNLGFRWMLLVSCGMTIGQAGSSCLTLTSNSHSFVFGSSSFQVCLNLNISPRVFSFTCNFQRYIIRYLKKNYSFNFKVRVEIINKVRATVASEKSTSYTVFRSDTDTVLTDVLS